MIVHDVAQGSAAWFDLRKGIPTASEFDKIIQPLGGTPLKKAAKDGRTHRSMLSDSWPRYAYRLVAERLLNCPLETMEGQTWMERGRELEPMAVKQFEFSEEVETVPVGFITTDDGSLGCSPDRLVKGQPIGVEIKAPSPAVHLGYLLDGNPIEYRPQVMGQLLVAELEEVIFYSYHPRMPPRVIRTYRDEPYIALLRDALAEFNAGLLHMLERARALGVFQAFEEAATPLERERAGMLSAEMLDAFGLPP